MPTSAPVLRLYYLPGSAAMAPHATLAASGLAYELVRVRRDGAEVEPAGYLELNPHGKVPTLVHGDFVLTESTAISAYVAALAPESGIGPERTPEGHARFHEWLAYLSTGLEAPLRRRMGAARMTTAADADGVAEAAAIAADAAFAWIGAQLADRPYLLGERLTAVDFHLMMYIRWGRRLDPPVWDRAPFDDYFRRVAEHPGAARMLAEQELVAS